MKIYWTKSKHKYGIVMLNGKLTVVKLKNKRSKTDKV